MPVKTDMPPAPKELLRIFRCNCKTGCSSKRCTCRRRHGLECTPACGECKGLSCSNSPKPLDDDNNYGLLNSSNLAYIISFVSIFLIFSNSDYP